MQLPDESLTYHYSGALIPQSDEWTAAAELRHQHFVTAARVRELQPRLLQVRSQVATERELKQVPPELLPLEAGFIDLPQKCLDEHRRRGEASTLGKIVKLAERLRNEVDVFVILGIGGSALGARALFQALKSGYHNELPAKDRSGTPRIYFEGDCFDNDSLQELLETLQIICVDPDIREERWGAAIVSKSGATLETLAAFRTLRRELAEFYGNHSPRTRNLVQLITGSGGKLRELCKAENYPEEYTISMPDDVGGRYSVFTGGGLFPAAIMGLDVRAILLGAAAMTRRFLDEPFERNPVLQYAAINYLMYTEKHKSNRVLAIWSKKLEALGHWYNQLVSESLSKQGMGPVPLTVIHTRDLHTRGQQLQDGPRSEFINNLSVKTPKYPAIMIGMSDRNEDELNQYNRKGYPDMVDAALRGTNQAYFEVARPTADLAIPALSEHAMGQLLQMLMLATVVEGRLMGVNPYGQPGTEVYRRNMRAILKG